jgi:hypothetical protein
VSTGLPQMRDQTPLAGLPCLSTSTTSGCSWLSGRQATAQSHKEHTSHIIDTDVLLARTCKCQYLLCQVNPETSYAAHVLNTCCRLVAVASGLPQMRDQTPLAGLPCLCTSTTSGCSWLSGRQATGQSS